MGAEISDEGEDGALGAVGGFEQSGFLELVAGGAVSVVGLGFGVVGAPLEEACGGGEGKGDDDIEGKEIGGAEGSEEPFHRRAGEMRLPATSVRRKSRPWNGNVNCS